MNREIEAVIFDMDGVIFDTELVYLEEWSKVFDKYGYTMTKEIYTKVLGTGRENVRKVFLKYYGDDLPIDDMYSEKDENLAKAVNRGIPVKEGAHEILRYLKENGYMIALATSAVTDRAMKQLKNSGLYEYFDAITCREEVLRTKPNPDIFLKAAEKINVNPHKCIVIEDSSAGIKGGFLAGMTPIHVIDLKEADEEILKYCYKSFNSLNEIIEELRENFHINK